MIQRCGSFGVFILRRHSSFRYSSTSSISQFQTLSSRSLHVASQKVEFASVPLRRALASKSAPVSSPLQSSPIQASTKVPPPASNPKNATDARSEELVNFYKRQFETLNRDRAKNYRKHRFGLIIIGLFLGSLSIGSCKFLLLISSRLL